MESPQPSERELIETVVLNAVQRYVGSRVHNEHLAADIVQDTMTRVLDAEERLSLDTLEAYAIVCAKSRIVDTHRSQERSGRLMPRLFTREATDNHAEDMTLADEERRALQAALQQLHEDDRDVLLEHHVEDVDLGELADQREVSTGSLAVRLARARAKLRVAYLLAYRRVELPTNKCHPVLLSISAGDRRRQVALLAGEHVVNCPVCETLAPPLLERDRGMTVVAPFGLMALMMKKAFEAAKAHPLVTSAGAVGTAGVAAAAVVALSNAPAPAPSPCQGVIDIASQPADVVGKPATQTAVVVRHAEVKAVAADEGFWIGCGSTAMWTQLQTPRESPEGVRTGVHVSFDATTVSHTSGYANSVGVDAQEGAAALDAQGFHIEVPADKLHIDQ